MNKIGIVGAGTMGSGIAQVAAGAGYEVVLRDIDMSYVERSLGIINKNLTKSVQKGRISEEDKEKIMGSITGTTELEKLADADLVIEAVTETMHLKKEILEALDEICSPAAILASNTSALSITEMAMVTKRPEKVIGMHFFNPAPVMRLIEVTKGMLTSQETFEAVKEVSIKLGKTPVTVNEAPGFIVNRILVPMINEAAYLLTEGVASARDIDEAMKLGANHPIGPLALADLIGLDVCLFIMEILYSEFGDSKYRPCPLLRKKVRAGQLGRKTGEGFFKYS